MKGIPVENWAIFSTDADFVLVVGEGEQAANAEEETHALQSEDFEDGEDALLARLLRRLVHLRHLGNGSKRDS